jgi:hypothetical protein
MPYFEGFSSGVGGPQRLGGRGTMARDAGVLAPRLGGRSDALNSTVQIRLTCYVNPYL